MDDVAVIILVVLAIHVLQNDMRLWQVVKELRALRKANEQKK
ncbi:MAG TPA: hypothetical protein PLO37_07070 [Candidatus Hydrogenedentes bacterium]|nr:hypothetical protein [Candidatus Hydrogenedentota bacterium]HPG66592.1 hypothetical protein [Candidatus Hydrogenedentota bacterium]